MQKQIGLSFSCVQIYTQRILQWQHHLEIEKFEHKLHLLVSCATLVLIFLKI